MITNNHQFQWPGNKAYTHPVGALAFDRTCRGCADQLRFASSDRPLEVKSVSASAAPPLHTPAGRPDTASLPPACVSAPRLYWCRALCCAHGGSGEIFTYAVVLQAPRLALLQRTGCCKAARGSPSCLHFPHTHANHPMYQELSPCLLPRTHKHNCTSLSTHIMPHRSYSCIYTHTATVFVMMGSQL
jgi:hypothetical protein